ncbi:MAG: CRTAC1 family protein [Thermoguttaceae bacterium]|nr:CRTAC1 family protein [Thermoguttaceae bacterium]MDW8079336.1 CRTAC1 family protein [Thermoguttaceae bacterium]
MPLTISGNQVRSTSYRLALGASAAVVIAWAVFLTTLAPVDKVEADPASPSAPSPTAGGRIQLRDMTAQSGITFVHTDGSSGRHWVIEPMTAGLATFDYDGDGLTDIYFLNGSPLPGYPATNEPPRNALYRNARGWQFTDVTSQAGVGDLGYGLGVAVGDFDNDGFSDIYISNFGPNVLYRNNGDGTFTDVTKTAGVATGNDIPAETKVGAGVCFLDMEGDGDLDIYCSNYMRFRFEDNIVPVVDGIPRYAGPKDFDPEADILFRNEGDGTFADVSRSSGIGQHKGTGMGIISVDFDDDGDTDVVVMNDVRGNFVFQNEGAGRFREVGLDVGVAYNADGMELASMGVDAGDYDNDGRIDLFQTSYASELPALYRNIDGQFFEDVTRTTGAGAGTYQHVTWGLGFADFDNDGFRDLFIGCGHLQDNVDLYDDSTSYRVRNVVLWNTGKGKFVDVSRWCGDGLWPEESTRGIALDDLDEDGRVDVVVLNSRSKPTIIRNESPAHNRHWVSIRLLGKKVNRDAIGSRIAVEAGGSKLVAEVHSGRGYQSHFGTEVHFGLGGQNRIDTLTIRWLGGEEESFHNLPVDCRLIVFEGGPVLTIP